MYKRIVIRDNVFYSVVSMNAWVSTFRLNSIVVLYDELYTYIRYLFHLAFEFTFLSSIVFFNVHYVASVNWIWMIIIGKWISAILCVLFMYSWLFLFVYSAVGRKVYFSNMCKMTRKTASNHLMNTTLPILYVARGLYSNFLSCFFF